MNEVTNVALFQNYAKEVVKLPAFEQLVIYNKSFNAFADQLHKLHNKINNTKKQIRKYKLDLPYYKQLNKTLAKEVKAERSKNAKLMQELRKEMYGKPLLIYKEERGLTFPQLAEIVGVPLYALRHAVYTGEISKHELIIRNFVKNLKVLK